MGGVLVVGEGESGRKVTMQHYLKGLPTASVDTVTFPVTPAATALPLKVNCYLFDCKVQIDEGEESDQLTATICV